MTVSHYSSKDAAFFQYLDEEIFVGDVLDGEQSETMSAGYYRNLKKGARNDWIVSYDEVLVVLRGALTIRSADQTITARPGEIIFLRKGTQIAYEAAEDDTEAVYVTYPHWLKTQQGSSHAHLLESYHPPKEP